MSFKNVKITRKAKKIAANHIERTKNPEKIDGVEYPADHLTVDATSIVVAVKYDPKADSTVSGHIHVVQITPGADLDLYLAAFLSYYGVKTIVVTGLDKDEPAKETNVTAEITRRNRTDWKTIGAYAALGAATSAATLGVYVATQKFMNR